MESLQLYGEVYEGESELINTEELKTLTTQTQLVIKRDDQFYKDLMSFSIHSRNVSYEFWYTISCTWAHVL